VVVQASPGPQARSVWTTFRLRREGSIEFQPAAPSAGHDGSLGSAVAPTIGYIRTAKGPDQSVARSLGSTFVMSPDGLVATEA
jgi:hypothetical protein